MNLLQVPLRAFFTMVEGWLDRIFTPAWNPFHHFGALGFFYLWIVTVSGLYVYIFFDTSTSDAYESVQYITHENWYVGGIMRSLHRYASDGMVLMMVVHIIREFAFDRFRGARWFTWVTGVPILWLVMAAGISGYWLVWDELAQYVAIRSMEWLDWLPIFGEPIARNFASSRYLEDRFFTLMMFLHIAIPLFLLVALWVHLNRVSRPRINPPRGLAIGTFAMMIVLAIVHPAVSHGPANLDRVPTVLHPDWYYLAFYPLMDALSEGAVWGLAAIVTITLMALPWMPPMRRRLPAAVVDLSNCNGCTRCEDDCPYAAITMGPRTDGKPFERQAVVDESRCVACGICAGACPTSTPFRRLSALTPGIDLPEPSIGDLRARLEAAAEALTETPRLLLIGCDHAADIASLSSPQVASLSLPCIGMLPPSFIDYALSRHFVEGVFITGCREGECVDRFGPEWTTARLAGERDPALRKRVPRDRIFCQWAARTDQAALARSVEAFTRDIAALPPASPPAMPAIGAAAADSPETEAAGHD